MRPMETLEYAVLVQELQPLAGKRFDKIYNIGKNQLRIKVGDVDLLIQLGAFVYATRQIPDSIELGNFSQKVRKELEGKRIGRILQANNDRIVVFEFPEHRLILEMFAQGNAILAGGEKILACYRNEQWKDRAIRPGETYRFPSSRPVGNFRECLSSRHVAADMAKLAYGMRYVKQALGQCGIDEKKAGTALREEEKICLEKILAEFRSAAKPGVFYREGVPVEYGLIRTSDSSHPESKIVSTLSEAIELCIRSGPLEEKNEALEKLERRFQKQKQALEKLRAEEAAARVRGDAIYTQYARVEEALAEGKKQKKRTVDMEL